LAPSVLVLAVSEHEHVHEHGSSESIAKSHLAAAARAGQSRAMSEANPSPAAASPLRPAPARIVGHDGVLTTGLFSGAVADASFNGLRAPYAHSFVERRLIEKKWQYVFVATKEMMFCLAVIDTGYLASGICAVFDRGSCRLLADENPVLPPVSAQIGDQPGEGLSARLTGPGIRARIARSGAEITVRASWSYTEIDLALDVGRAPAPLTAIAPVGPVGRFDLTQKTVLIPAEGEVRAGNIRFPVQGELAGLDFTHGYLARDTAWRWAFATGRVGNHRIAFNFSEGFLQGEGENAVWIDGDPQPAGKVIFTFDGNAPLSPWRIRSEDGRVDLAFQPEGHRAQSIDLMLIASKYVQPFGSFSGSLHGVQVEGLAGVTEDHIARW
jgi:hypothetical protein